MYQIMISPLDGSRPYWYRLPAARKPKSYPIAKYSDHVDAAITADQVRKAADYSLRADVIYVTKRSAK